jgi:hypothetical protein
MSRRLFLVTFICLAAAGCGKRAIVQQAVDFRGDEVRRGRTAYVLATPIDAKAVAKDLVASFDGKAEVGLQQLKDELAAGLSGARMNCPGSEFGASQPFPASLIPLSDRTPSADAMACLKIAEDELGIARASAVDGAKLQRLLADHGFDYLLIFDHLTLDRRTVERGDPFFGVVVGECAMFGGQVYIWSNAAGDFVYNGFVGGAAASKRVDKDDIRFVVCSFLEDLSKALH